MKLTRGDQRWIRALLQSEEHREIICSRLADEKLLMARRGRWGTVARNVLGLWLLFGEALLSPLRRRRREETGVVFFYESNPTSLYDREAYLRYHLMDERFYGISYASRLLPGLPAAELARWLVTLSGYILQAVFFPSVLSSQAVRIARTCLLAGSTLAAHRQRQIYLFRLYQIETSFLASYLRERGVTVMLIPSTTPLTPVNQRLIGDRLMACNPYQRDEFAHYAALGVCKQLELWSPEDIVQLEEFYAGKEKPDQAGRLGLYTQGFWLRAQMNLMPAALVDEMASSEAGLIQILLSLLDRSPSLSLTIFPHPLERRHYHKTGLHQFGALAGHPQIAIDFSGNNSIFTFNQVGLGLTTVSTIGFDRIFLGFRTLFYIPSNNFLDTRLPSAYQSLFCDTPESLLAQINALQAMSHAEFMQRTFGAEFWQPQKGRADRNPATV